MSTDDTNTSERPLGYWLRIVDALLDREFATAFEGEEITRRDWMLLNVLSRGVELPGFAERFARKGKRLRRLEERGWVEEQGDGTWTLTDEGRAATARLGEIVDGIRARVSGAVSPDDFATTMASLEAIARELGWEEGMRMPHRRFGRRGFRPGFGPAFGPGFGYGPGFGHGFGHGPGFGRGFGYGPGFGPAHGGANCHGERAHGGHAHGEHPRHGGHGHRKHGERAYERGFEAGFARGREAHSA